MSFLVLSGIDKRFGSVVAVDNLTLEVAQGEVVALIGPSGCGKTTTLRIISGLERADAGRVFLRGKDVTSLPPEARAVGLVFQSYALFPHLTVEKNVAYGLRRMPRRERSHRAKELLQLVGLEEHGGRRPHQLSQGQKQRVALARALAPQPNVLLLDEPLAALDAALRTSLRSELKHMLHQLGVTALYVTHDQAEALALADRLAVMRAGVLEQEGPPERVYMRPESPFVARFLGRANIWPARVTEVRDGQAQVDAGGETFTAPAGQMRTGDKAYLFSRPEDVQPGSGIPFQVERAEYQGDRWEVQARRGELEVLVYVARDTLLGAEVQLSFPPSSFQLLPRESDR